MLAHRVLFHLTVDCTNNILLLPGVFASRLNIGIIKMINSQENRLPVIRTLVILKKTRHRAFSAQTIRILGFIFHLKTGLLHIADGVRKSEAASRSAGGKFEVGRHCSSAKRALLFSARRVPAILEKENLGPVSRR